VAPLEPEHDSLPMALFAGSAAALVGAVLWGVFTYVTHVKLGWIAVLIGVLVGYAVRTFGKGTGPMFQVLGAVLSLSGCVAGNLLMVCLFYSRQQDVPLPTVLSHLGDMLDVMVEWFRPMDLLFYAIAVYEGYKFSRAPLPVPPKVPGLSA